MNAPLVAPQVPLLHAIHADVKPGGWSCCGALDATSLGCAVSPHSALPICDHCGLEYDPAQQSAQHEPFLPPTPTPHLRRAREPPPAQTPLSPDSLRPGAECGGRRLPQQPPPRALSPAPPSSSAGSRAESPVRGAVQAAADTRDPAAGVAGVDGEASDKPLSGAGSEGGATPAKSGGRAGQQHGLRCTDGAQPVSRTAGSGPQRVGERGPR